MFLLTVAMVCLAMFYWNSKMASEVKALEAKVQEMNDDLVRYKKKNLEVAKLKKQLDTLEKKTEVVKSLARNREEAVRLLDTMTEVIVPGRMWLTRFDAGATRVTLTGTAIDNRTIADFMQRIEKVNRFSNVALQASKHMVYRENVFLKNFSLTFDKKPIVKKKADNKG